MSGVGKAGRAQPHQNPNTCCSPDHHAHRVDTNAQRTF